MDTSGYILVHAPNHPRADNSRRIKRAILVAEQNLGRFLLPGEITHHINGIKTDDNPENIQVYGSQSLHARFHALKNGLGTYLREGK